MKKSFAFGAYPTMITPYNSDNTIDCGAVRALVDWYWENGCCGIFASCQSSEIHCLSLSERVLHAQLVKEEADRLAAANPGRTPMTVVASGHISNSFDKQVEELNAVAGTGIDALVLISNRLDIDNTSDAKWISDCERLISALPADMPLGIYECPRPYKRLLTPEILRYCTQTGRFAFIKDTCCNAAMMAERIALVAETEAPVCGYKPALFNANAQTLLSSLRSGAVGYCGVMCNFHPDLYAWLCSHYQTDVEKAELLASFLSTSAFLEALPYPCTAKYHLNKTGVSMNLIARTCDAGRMTDYEMMCVDYLDKLADHFRDIIVN